jgi:RHS repeat-associated protein
MRFKAPAHRYCFSFVLLLALGLVLALRTAPGSKNPKSQSSGATLGATSEQPHASASVNPRIAATYGKLPLSFEANQGQTDGQVKFLSRGSGRSLFLTGTEAVLVLSASRPLGSNLGRRSLGLLDAEERAIPWNPHSLLRQSRAESRKPLSRSRDFQSEVIRLKLVGANPGAQVGGLEELPGKSNYFIGNDPTKWRTNVPNYAKVEYRDVYPGVNLVYYGNGQQLEHDFVIAPGADPSVIRFAVEGADKVELDAQGDLVLSTNEGEVRLRRPVVYQDADGARQEIAGTYILHDRNPQSEIRNPQSAEVGFQLAAYDVTRPLVIDPVLVYSTYLGGSGSDGGAGIAVDSAGNAYVTGSTSSTNFPTSNPFQAASGNGSDVFVAKLNAAGSALVYSTYLGGSGDDSGRAISIDSSGNAYLTGVTLSTDFPTHGAYQGTRGSGFPCAFVTKVSASGSALLYSTYLCGSGVNDSGNGIAADSFGNAYVTGTTGSFDFPVVNPYQSNSGGTNTAFVAKLNTAVTGTASLVYSTYLGGNNRNEGQAIAVDLSGCVYVTGYTRAANFPTTPGAYDRSCGTDGVCNSLADDVFVAKLDPSLPGAASLIYSTFLGGSADDLANGIAVDTWGRAYVTGYTLSTDFPLVNPFQSVLRAARGNVFVARLSSTGSHLEYSTYLGGTWQDVATSIAVDLTGSAYLTGYTWSTDFPTLNAFQATNGGYAYVAPGSPNITTDAFVAELNASGSALVYASYFGGRMHERGSGIAVGASGNAYLTGYTDSSDFPTTPSAYDRTCGTDGSCYDYDTFVTKVGAVPPPSPPPSTTVGATDTSTNRTGSIAEPVNTATGNYYSSTTDIVVPGKGLSFSFTRSYNSKDTYNGPMAYGWTHSYNIYLTEDTSTGAVKIKQGDGHEDFYTPTSGGNYAPQTLGLFNALRKNGDGSFTLTFKNQTQYGFSAAGKLVTIVDRNGNTQTLAYDSGGKLSSVTDTSGRAFTFGYDANNRIISLTGPLNRVLRYAYDASGNLISFQDAANAVTQYAYDASHCTTSATDPRGKVFLQNTYDAQGRVVTQTNARGFSTTFAYDTPSAGTTTITDPLGNVTKHVYDTGLRLVAIIDARGGTGSTSYDLKNLKTSTADALGRATFYTYDSSNGNMTGVTNSDGNLTTFLYDSQNNLLKTTDALGHETTFTYDAKGNLLSTTDAAGNISTFTYDSAGLMLTSKNARGFTTTYQYDANGNRTKIIDALGGTVEMTYDAAGRLLTTKNQLGKVWTRTYDADDRLLTAADPLGNATSYVYDANGNRTSVTDANGNPTAYAYDEANNLVRVTDAEGGVTRYAYDANNDLTTVTDANGHASTNAYDSVRRLKSRTDPIGNVQRYDYDAVGNITSTVDGNAKTNTHAYDVLNRRVFSSLSDGKSVAYTYDAAGNRLTMTDWRGTTNYTYDTLSRVTGVATPDGKTVGYAYDAMGNRASLTYPDGKVVNYGYDALNRMTKVTDWSNLATTYAYDAAGNLTGQVNPNNTSAAYAYDDAGRLASLVNRSGTQPISAFSYVLDRVGNRIEVASLTEGVQRYGYDRLYRLTSWTQPSRQIVRYVYDAVGNRTAVHAPSGITNYAYDAADQLLSAGPTTFTYDGNGNQLTKTTGGTTVTYGWDAVNRLLSVTGAATSTAYQYDGDGNRLGQTVAAGTYAYVNDSVASLPVVLQEAGPEGGISYLHGPVVTMAAGATFQSYYQVDGLGSVSTVTDGAGALKAGYTYDPWGTAGAGLDLLGTKNKFRFAGEPTDPGTGLVYLRARYYDPTTGRFIARDARPDPSGATNLYNYALANPVRFVDKSGFGIFGFIGEFLGLAQRGDQLREARRQAIECAADIACADVDAAQRQFYGAEQEAWKSGGRMAVQGLGVAYGPEALSGFGALQTDIPFQEGSVLYYAQKGYGAYETVKDVTEGVRAYQSLRSGPVLQSPYTNTTGPIGRVTGTYASPGSSKRRK